MKRRVRARGGGEMKTLSGLVQRFTDLPIDRYITIVEGQAKWA